MHPHLFHRQRARQGARACVQGRTEGSARRLDRTRSREERAPDQHGCLAGEGSSRGGRGAHRRQRSAAARRHDGGRSSGHHPLGQAARERAGDLCRCLGVLAALPRSGRGCRFRHRPFPALLGGRAAARRRCGRACRRLSQAGGGSLSRQGGFDRRDRLAELRADARRRAGFPRQPGAFHFPDSRAGETGKFSRQFFRGL